SLAREMDVGTTPTIEKPRSLAPRAAPRAVLPMDGTTNWRVPPSRVRCSSKWPAPRILKEPDGARNSHLAYTRPAGNRLPSRTSGVRTVNNIGNPRGLKSQWRGSAASAGNDGLSALTRGKRLVYLHAFKNATRSA